MPKRMFEVKRNAAGDIESVHINASSLSVMQECQRKADYLFNRGLISESSEAQKFGTAIHQALADWYLLPKAERTMEAIEKIWETRYALSGHSPVDEKKTKETGKKALQVYADYFSDDDFAVMVDSEGRPCIEYEFEVPLAHLRYCGDLVPIFLFGTIDMIVSDRVTGQVHVLDHKTTSVLGEQFMNQWKPNHQMSAYVLAAQKLGMPCKSAWVQGIQIVKTKQVVCRLETERSDEELEDFKHTVLAEVGRFLQNLQTGFFPGADSYTCAAFSGCQFQGLCQVSRGHRERLIEARQRELRGEGEGLTQSLMEDLA